MKKLFTEPELEILKFLCNDTGIATADTELLPDENEGTEGILP